MTILPSRRSLNVDRRSSAYFLLGLALLFGLFVRLYPVIQSGFPLNDGGLFYTMTLDLQKAHFNLPAATSYNHLNIPFIYPSLPFYITAFLLNLTHTSLLAIIRWLPLFFSFLSIPAFFLLARVLLEDDLAAGLATVIYALLPRSYEWVIMGGGTTRAPAALFLILMTLGAYRLFRQGGWKWALLTLVSGTLVILTHPERSLHAVLTAALLYLYFGRNRAGLKWALIVAAGVLVLTLPWWITIFVRHEWAAFFQAFRASGQRWQFWSPLLLLDFTDETIAIGALLSVVGIAACLVRKKTFLPVWLVLTFFVDPRSAPHVVAVQTALLSAIGLSEVIFPAISRVGKQTTGEAEPEIFLTSKSGRWAFSYVLLMLLVNAVLNLNQLRQFVLPQADRAAMQWIAEYIPAPGRFLVLVDQKTSGLSPLLEWFPALTGRTNISTTQGREWLPGDENYAVREGAYAALQACLARDTACLENWAGGLGDTFGYVYLSLAAVEGQPPRQNVLALSLLASDRYQLIYQTPSVLIFSVR